MGQDDARVAHHTLARIGTAARFGFGTAETGTDTDGDTMVLPDGIPLVTSTTAETELEDGVQFVPDPNQPNQPVPALTVCGPVAVGERVAWVSLPAGPMLVVGSLGSQARLIGLTTINGARANQTETNTSEHDVDDLAAVDVEVTHPGHLIVVHTMADVQANAALGATGRMYRDETSDEDSTTSTEIGRWFRMTAMTNTQVSGATRPCFDTPDPGIYTYRPTMQVTATGFTIVTAPTGSTPLYSAALAVYDMGPIPEAFTQV